MCASYTHRMCGVFVLAPVTRVRGGSIFRDTMSHGASRFVTTSQAAIFLRGLLALAFGWLVLATPLRAFANEGHVRGANMGVLTKPALPTHFVQETRDFGMIAYEPRAKERVADALNAVSGFREELSGRFGYDVLKDVEVRVVSSPEEMRALAPLEVAPPSYAVGVTYPSAKLVLVSLIAPRTFEGTDLAEVLKHELVHVAIDEALEGHRVPRWFNEGVAIYASGENAGARVRALADASMTGSLIPIAQLDRNFGEDGEVSTAYAQSADFVRFLLRAEDQERFRSLIARVRGGATFERALEDAYATRLNKLEYQWREQVGRHYAYYPAILASSLVWVLVIGALGLAYYRKRRRSDQILAHWGREEALEDALYAARQELSNLGTAREERESRALPHLPTAVEHEGRIYNIH